MRAVKIVVIGVAFSAAVTGCGDLTGSKPAIAFGLSPRSPVGQQGMVGTVLSPLIVRASDSIGRPLPNVQITFAVEPDGGTISPNTVRTNSSGDAVGTWTLGTKAGTYAATATADVVGSVTFVAVADPAPLTGSWELNGYAASLIPGRTFQTVVNGHDAYGNTVSRTSAVWGSSNTAVATVTADGLIRGVMPGTATISVSFSGAGSKSISVGVDPLEWTQIHADGTESSVCGLVTTGEAFCWGKTSNAANYPQWVPDTARYSAITSSCGLSVAGVLHCGIGSSLHGGFPAAAPVPSTVSFSVLSNRVSTCALTSAGVAYCLGDNTWGQLGNGVSGQASPNPTPVAGGLNFTSISASGTHVCAIAASGNAYCWGKNDFGQLGTASTGCGASGSFDPCPTPVPVSGGISFKTISAGSRYSCGVAVDGTGYCWGDSTFVPWRDGLAARNPAPSTVQGGLVFKDISVATSHACGLTTAGAAVCWGQNTEGALGRGTATLSLTQGWPPGLVESGLTFDSISVGSQFSCAITPQKSAYCWGDDIYGELGDGKSANATPNDPLRSVTPVLIPRVFQ